MIIVKKAETEEEKMLSYKLRYQIYVTERKYISPEKCPYGYEKDEYDQYSDIFIALDEGEIVGTVRLIRNSPLGFPTEKFYEFEKPSFSKEEMAEVSRLIMTTKKAIVLWLILKNLYLHLLTEKIEYVYGTMSEKDFEKLRKIGFLFEEIKEAKFLDTEYLRNYFDPVKKGEKIVSTYLVVKNINPLLRKRIFR